jgi:hypothetical protein
MFYKLLGMAVWRGAKWYLGRRMPARPGPKMLAIGGATALGLGAAAILAKRATS